MFIHSNAILYKLPHISISPLLPEKYRILAIVFPEHHHSRERVDRELFCVVLEQCLICLEESHLLLDILCVFGELLIYWCKLLAVAATW